MRKSPKINRKHKQRDLDSRISKKCIDLINLVFANTVMAVAMKTRERAKDIRHAQQQDLYERQELRKF